MKKIIIVEDHVIVRNGIKLLLDNQRGVEVIAEAGNGLEALEFIKSGIVPDVILTDINMPEMDGIALIKLLRTDYPEIKTIVLSMLNNEKYVAQAFLEGCNGYLLKNVTEDEMMFALKTIGTGKRYICTELSESLLDRFIQRTVQQAEQGDKQIELSIREIEVLHLVAEGLTNVQMAERLFLSKRTIEGHRQTLLDKTGSQNSAALIRFAFMNGFLD
ncbi:MAG: response regulator transcription factor [Chitinophagaceae bacterium]|nr:MAG: response regulator transcription factor [Chitinophagaceae bacterium]